MKAWCRRFGSYWIERFSEKSTYAGVALWGVCLGPMNPPHVMEAIAWWGPMVASALIAANTTPPPEQPK